MKLADYLAKNDLTPEAFGKKAKVTRPTVTRWRDGKRMPRVDHLKKIREITNGAVTADDFVDVVA